ncbi:hypothetical protein NDU88_010632 [Pleurodeles waltl]|uniref:G-protein coupled receptors family 1 profile domain-containing protein n=1 Tax=Pleurodeles waltl TaxID=8319 RepID=A0AAV7PVF4_PLEWA|nr:hypothetical protein NDU88_010632 [Pleurodeles waltl]
MKPGSDVDMNFGVFFTYVILLLLGVLGNVVVIRLTLKPSGRRIPPVDLLISNLSLVNLCSIITRSTPVLLYQAFGGAALGGALCKVLGFASILSGSMSAWLTVLLSAYYTLKLRSTPTFLMRALGSTTPMKICLATFWITWGSLLSPTLMYINKDIWGGNQTSHGNYSQANGMHSLGNIRRYYGCVLVIGHTRKEKMYLYSCVILCEILPAAMMLTASTMIIHTILKYRKMLVPTGELPLQVNNWVGPTIRCSSRSHCRAGLLVLALVSTYLVCWATHFTVLAVSFNKAYQLAPALINGGRVAYAIYPVLCPFGLGLGRRKFQVSLRDSLCCVAAKKRRNQTQQN